MKKIGKKKLFLVIALGIFLSTGMTMSVKAENNKSTGVEENQSTKGPKVEDVTLQETYHGEYEIYSERIGGKFYFYTNTPNNGITSQPVSLDIPANIYYTVQKDGVDIAYTSKQKLSQMGTYVFQMSAVKNPTSPVSEQIVYNTTYSFRIQPKPYVPESDTEDDWSEDFMEEIIEEPEIIETQVEETEEPYFEEEITGISTEFTYDFNTGNYIRYFEEDYYLECSVVNGIITNESVYVNLDGLGLYSEEVLIKKDSEEFEFPSDGVLSDNGNYEIEIHIKENIYKYFFEIIKGASALPEKYGIPEQLSLIEVLYQGEKQNLERYKSSYGLYTVTFEQEGVYSLVMMDEFQNIIETKLNIDRTAPEVTLNETKNGVRVVYDKDDVKKIILQQGDKQEEKDSIDEINKKGTYTLYLYDEAGNTNPVTFTIKKSINAATVVFILLVISLIAGAVIYFKKVKKNINIK